MVSNNEHNTIDDVLFLKTSPGESVSFNLASDSNAITISGIKNGEIKFISNSRIEYTPNEEFNGTETFICSYNKGKENKQLSVNVKVGYSFKAKSHVLSLLGNELIGSDNLAIFELVKNSYDADAEEVKIIFDELNTPNQQIIIEDDGDGMSLETIKNVWLEIGTDFKRGEKRKPSNKFGRISLGEKGVGRLAVHKLGESIVLETQLAGATYAYRLGLNWQELMNEYEYINDTSVHISKIEDAEFFRKKKGTRIVIGDLKKKHWERRELRELARKINSIISPFKQVKGRFEVEIIAPGFEDWITDVKDVDTLLLEDSIYQFEFNLKKSNTTEFANLSWTYKFKPPKSFEIKGRNEAKKDKEDKTDGQHYNVFNIKVEKNDPLYYPEQKHLTNSDLEGMGEINGRFYVYNLLAVVLKAFGQTQAIKSFVKENCGVKIFRDGIRVYNYGEVGDDWLGLDLARVQRLGSHFSKNITIGAIEITQEGSFQGLKEKTNREGFDENLTYQKFRNICYQVFKVFESIAQKDRDNLSDYLEGLAPVKSVGLPDTINALVEKLKEKKVDKEVAPLLKRVEKDYNDMRDVMLNSGMTGINLGIVFHEVDREVHFINADLKNNIGIENIKQRVKNLIQLLENFSPILKQNKTITIQAAQLAERAKQINNARFIYHKVILSSPLISMESEDFLISGPGNLLISAISNIIDNAIYWVTNKRELEGSAFKPAIYIGSDIINFNGPAIIIADNGNGFNLEPEDLIRPYRTTRPGGMGLGLYFVNLVMEMIGGKLLFPDKENVEIPKAYNGALLALVFPKR